MTALYDAKKPSDNAGEEIMGRGRVLVVDDEPDINEAVCLTLREAGYKTQQALDGQQCLKAISLTTPDLLVLDIALPDIDGWELITRLKHLGHDIPILITSASRHAGDKLLGFNLVANQDYIVKPFELADLVDRVDRILKPEN